MATKKTRKFWKHLGKVPDFPKQGVTFFDISPILNDGILWRGCVEDAASMVLPYKPDRLIAIEARGFLIAAPLAYKMGVGFTMVRKTGKLPGPTASYRYELEYGEDSLEIQSCRVRRGERVVIVDDVVATGGTMAATAGLLKQEGVMPLAGICLLELSWLRGREKIGIPLSSLEAVDLEEV